MTRFVPKAPSLPPSGLAFTLDANRPILTHERSMDAETSITAHRHPRGQLLWAAEGILSITSEQTVWVVPSTHAVWIPGGIEHQVSSQTAAQVRNIYIDPSYPIRQAEHSVVMLTMTALMREVILRLTQRKLPDTEQFKRLGLVAIDELELLEPFDIRIPSGHDPRLRKLINTIVNNPNDNFTLVQLANIAGGSVRTIERLFKSETGMTFRQWRSRFRLMNSLDLLCRGQSTTFVAHALGYKSVSSFVSTFRLEFGSTPQEYARSRISSG